jgi:hypothetical protein
LSRCRDSCRKLDQVKVVGSTKVVELWTRYVVGSRASDVIVCPSAGCPYFGVRVTVLQLLSHKGLVKCVVLIAQRRAANQESGIQQSISKCGRLVYQGFLG